MKTKKQSKMSSLRFLKLLLAATLITSISSFQDKMAVIEFKILTYQTDPKDPQRITPVSETKHKGILLIQNNQDYKIFSLKLTFGELNQTDLKHSKVLEMNFAYQLNNADLIGNEITFSPTALNESFQIPETAVAFYKISQSLLIGTGKRIHKEAKIDSLKFKIINAGNPDQEPTTHRLKSLEVIYLEQNTKHKIQLESDHFDRTDPTDPLDLILNLLGFVLIMGAPIYLPCISNRKDWKCFKCIYLFFVVFLPCPIAIYFLPALLRANFGGRGLDVMNLLFLLFLLTIRITIGFVLYHSGSDKKRKRDPIYFLILGAVTVIWVTLIFYDFSFLFRLAFFMAILILVDVCRLHRSSDYRKNSPLKMWSTSISALVVHQIGVYSLYWATYRGSN